MHRCHRDGIVHVSLKRETTANVFLQYCQSKRTCEINVASCCFTWRCFVRTRQVNDSNAVQKRIIYRCHNGGIADALSKTTDYCKSNFMVIPSLHSNAQPSPPVAIEFDLFEPRYIKWTVGRASSTKICTDVAGTGLPINLAKCQITTSPVSWLQGNMKPTAPNVVLFYVFLCKRIESIIVTLLWRNQFIDVAETGLTMQFLKRQITANTN